MDIASPGITYYSAGFSAFYDKYYTEWSHEFALIASNWLSEMTADHTVLDLCCGSGVVAQALVNKGWSVTGIDFSAEMLQQAGHRLSGAIADGRASLIQADAANFELAARFGACVCLEGALNHLLSAEQVQACFRHVHKVLRPGARFIFDLYEAAHFRNWHQVSVTDRQDVIVVKRGVWDESTQQGMLRVSGAFKQADESVWVNQTLSSRAHSSSDIAQWLDEAGFDLLPWSQENPICRCGQPVPESCRTIYHAVRRPECPDAEGAQEQ